MTQRNHRFDKTCLNFPANTGRKTQLIEKKSSKNSTISKKQAYQRKSVQYESNLGISLIENGNPSNGYALRSRKSDFVRVSRTSFSFLASPYRKPLSKKRYSPKHPGRRKSSGISVESKLVNQENTISIPVSKCKQNGNRNANLPKSGGNSNLSDEKLRSTESEGENIKVQQKSHKHKNLPKNLHAEMENNARSLQKRTKNNSVNIMTASASRPFTSRNKVENSLDMEVKVGNEIAQCGKRRKKSEGIVIHMENSVRSYTPRKSERKSLSLIKVDHEIVNGSGRTSLRNSHCKVDCLTDDSLKIQTRRKTKNTSDCNVNHNNSLFFHTRQSERFNDMKIKPIKGHPTNGSKSNKETNFLMKSTQYKEDCLTAEPNAKQAKTQRQTKPAPVRYGNKIKDKISNKKQSGKPTKSLKTKPIGTSFAKKLKNEEINTSVKNIENDGDSLSASSSPIKSRTRKQTKTLHIPVEHGINYIKDNSLPILKKCKEKSLETSKAKPLKKSKPIHSTPYAKNVRSKSTNICSKASNLSILDISRVPIDSLSTFNIPSAIQFNGSGSSAYTTPYFSKFKTRSLPITNRFVKNVAVKKRKVQSYSKEKSSPGALKTKMPTKGTLKRKRWMLNALNEKNDGYEDDIFESGKFGALKAFQFGEESDSSSVNIATPKFDCILTPALPKKTPRFQDCISPTELLLARKNAEEYLYRRNKKRKSGNEAAVSVTENNKTIGNSVQDVPEKKKLDFKEAINKLNSIQKKLEQEDGDEEEDTYFSDVSD